MSRTKGDKPVLVPISYEGSDDKDIETILENNSFNNNCNAVSDSSSDNEEGKKRKLF